MMFDAARVEQEAGARRAPHLGGLFNRPARDTRHVGGLTQRPLAAVVSDLLETDGVLEAENSSAPTS